VDSIPDGVINLIPPAALTLESTQPLIEILVSAKGFSWGVKRRPVGRADNLATFISLRACARISLPIHRKKSLQLKVIHLVVFS